MTLGEGDLPVLWIGHYQEVRGEDGKLHGGHYQSLVEAGAPETSKGPISRAENLRGFPSLWRAEPKQRVVDPVYRQKLSAMAKKAPRPIDPDYRGKVEELAKQREKRQKQIEALREELRKDTWDLINSKTETEIQCPDCHKRYHRGGGLVNHRLNHCKKSTLRNMVDRD